MSPFPDEILANILSRLPVKCLLRSRCVSKPWLALISSSYFIKLHLNRSVQTKSNLGLLMWKGNSYRVNNDSLDNGVLQPIEVDNHPLRCYKNFGTFGDPVVSVVIAKDARGGDACFEVKVYSLKSNSWRKSENCLHCPDLISTGGSIAGGAMHWISNVISDSEKESLIVAFDFRTKKYRLIPQPEFRGLNSYLYLDNLRGCLSLSCQYQSMNVDLFLLKEYGENSEYWSKFVTMSPITPFGIVHVVKPIAYSKSGKKVLLEVYFQRFVWYNLEQESVEEIKVHDMDDYFEVFTCMESLVSVNVAADVTNANAMKNLHEKEENNMNNSFIEGAQKMSLIPDEILADILCRLPVKCLLRLRCVSKSWLSLISSSHFVKLHLSPISLSCI
ncbi:F-box protein CPR1-like [Impatiens glandulifera]|uniref:F-box protein CPR1-like n=1 Tax=Impatiens glandulifera TaxID=253017 RepID=UPI001FB0F7C7|nr:F-box protein CPR1-like [Impatiens glandulifera]